MSRTRKTKRYKKAPKARLPLSEVMLAVQIVLSVLFIICLGSFDVLPDKYFIPVCAVIGVLCLLSLILCLARRSGKRMAGFALSLVAVAAMVTGMYYITQISGAMQQISTEGESYEVISLVVLNDSKYESESDITAAAGNLTLGVRELIDTDNTEYALKEINDKIGNKFESTSYVSFDDMANALYNGEVNMLLLNEKFFTIIDEHFSTFVDDTRIIYRVKRVVESGSQTAQSSDITTKPFAVYITGMDNYGDIDNTGCSDVNMLIVVDPVNKEVLLVSIPRDYYVAIEGDSSKMDKLTHTGAYGVDCSVSTIEALFGISIEYHVKVNFTSVLEIVDALGGISVESDATFTSGLGSRNDTYYFVEGMNQMDGAQALAFARERMAFTDGDLARGRHQEAVVKGIIAKVISPAIITNFSGVLSAVVNSVSTNMTVDMMTSFLQMQLTDMAAWDIRSISLDGTGAYRYTYSYGSSELYVMMPDEELLASTITEINTILNGAADDAAGGNATLALGSSYTGKDTIAPAA